MGSPPKMGRLVAAAAIVAWASADYEIFRQRYSADPAPMVHDGRLWLYTSHDNGEPGYTMTDYNALSSDDLVNWRDEGIVFSVANLTWVDYAWAQQVIELPNGTFAMYYAAWCSGRNPNCTTPGVGVAYAAHPAGPFVDVLGAAIMPGNDPGAFVDPDDPETRVLCSNVRPDQSPGNYGPLCGFLEADMVTWRPGSPFPLPGFNLTTWRFFEAPWLSKIGGRYYLSYMMHGTDIGYAVSDDVLGNYTPMGALMWTPPYDCDDVDTSNNSRGYGPNNHQGMVEFPAGSGEHYLAYHTRKLQQDRNLTARARNVGIDRMYAKDGRLLPVTATPRWLRPLKYVDPFVPTPAVTLASCADGVEAVAAADDDSPARPALRAARGAWTRVRAVDFGGGASSVTLRVATAAAGSAAVEVRTSGAWVEVAACALPATEDAWATVTCAVSGLRGVADEVRFVFGVDVRFGWWRFEGSRGAPAPPPPTRGRHFPAALAAVGANGAFVACAGGVVAATGNASSRLAFVDNDDGTYALACGGAFVAADGLELALSPEPSAWRLQGVAQGPYYALQAASTRAWLVAAPGGALTVDGASTMLGPPGNERNVVDEAMHFAIVELD